jgi:hypothetical protein
MGIKNPYLNVDFKMGQLIFVTSSYQKFESKYGFGKKITSPKKASFFALTFDRSYSSCFHQ